MNLTMVIAQNGTDEREVCVQSKPFEFLYSSIMFPISVCEFSAFLNVIVK